MGKLMHSTQIKHSSHPHLLHLSSTNIHQSSTCGGCNLQLSPNEHIYTCMPCNFFLHPSCSKFPELITHPSHREHSLSLLPNPIYPGGFFRCDACTQQGTRFSYHCHYCDFDLHVLCASKPLSVNHPFHTHPLVLTFSSPYGEKCGFSCDVCSSVGSSEQWLYRCVSCEFDVHLHCATTKPPLQHQNSYPGAGSTAQSNQFMGSVAGQPLTHSVSTGHGQTYWQPSSAPLQQNHAPGGFQSYQQPLQPQPLQQQNHAPGGFQSYQQPLQPQPLQQQNPTPGAFQSYQQPLQPQPVGVQSYQCPPQAPPPVGVQSYQMQQQPAGPPVGNQNAEAGNGLGDVIVTGFVDGMMQQLGQNFIQSLTGGGGGGGGCDGDGGGGYGGDGGGGGYGGGGGGCGGGGGDGSNVDFATCEDYGN